MLNAYLLIFVECLSSSTLIPSLEFFTDSKLLVTRLPLLHLSYHLFYVIFLTILLYWLLKDVQFFSTLKSHFRTYLSSRPVCFPLKLSLGSRPIVTGREG